MNIDRAHELVNREESVPTANRSRMARAALVLQARVVELEAEVERLKRDAGVLAPCPECGEEVTLQIKPATVIQNEAFDQDEAMTTIRCVNFEDCSYSVTKEGSETACKEHYNRVQATKEDE